MPCTHDKHDRIKADAVKWANETYPIAPAPIYGLEWRNCADCNSTLVVPVEGEVQS